MKTLILSLLAILLTAGLAFAQMMGGMGGDHMGGGTNGGQNVGSNMGGIHMGGGMGSGMAGAGGMVSGMMGNTMSHGYLDVLHPIATTDEARTAIQTFINSANSNLQISELWDYETVYKAELSDATGVKAFDMIADKFTGVVSPDMGFSMMMNASYAKGFYNMPKFGKNLSVTPEQATSNAQNFVAKNELGYILEAPEIYPGYYKLHTKDGADFGMDIMVNGYNGGIWMNTLLGVPNGRY